MTRIRKYANEDGSPNVRAAMSPEKKREFDESLQAAKRFELFLQGYRGPLDDLEREWLTNADAYISTKETSGDIVISEIERHIQEAEKVLAQLEADSPTRKRTNQKLTVGEWNQDSKEWVTDKTKLAGDEQDTGKGLSVGRWNPKTKKWET